jgi:Pyruvate/2-oxoacid:ferredoxin oxidoreductase gamma subunit
LKVKEILTEKEGGKLFLLGNEAAVRGALEGGVSVVSTYPGTPSSEIENLFIIDTQKITKEAGNIISENMVLLGVATATPNFPIGKDLIIQSMKENLPPKSIETNLKAFEMGFEEVKK